MHFSKLLEKRWDTLTLLEGVKDMPHFCKHLQTHASKYNRHCL